MRNNRKATAVILGILAYIIWGFLTIFWKVLNELDAIYILSHRIVWSMVCMGIFLLITRRFDELKKVFKSKKQMAICMACGIFITLNWGIYIYAVSSGHIVEASLGYFIEPVMAALISVIVFKERLNNFEKITLILAFIGIGYLVITTGRLPVLSLIIGIPFVIYGAIKKNSVLSAYASLFMETLVVTPIALVYIIWSEVNATGAIGMLPLEKFWLLPVCGIATLIPLILFNMAVKDLPYYISAIIMYINPTIQFMLGVILYKEEMDENKLIAFIFIWIGILFTIIGKIKQAKEEAAKEAKMIKIVSVGTSSITKKVIGLIKENPKYKYVGACSRNSERAKAFANELGVEKYYGSIEELCIDETVDAVYVATPNAVHHDQVIKLLDAGKHVLCEKSLASNTREAKEMFEAAKANNVLLLEAMRTIYDPAFKAISENLDKIGDIRKGCLEYCQYSSRYDILKAGEHTNIFDPNLAEGALTDIGIYCIEALVALFGKPDAIKSAVTKLNNGSDGAGDIFAMYEGKNIVVSYSKITDSKNYSQIQGEKATMYISQLPNPKELYVMDKKGNREDIAIPESQSNIIYELDVFADALNSRDFSETFNYGEKISMAAHEIMDEVRSQCGIHFPADK